MKRYLLPLFTIASVFTLIIGCKDQDVSVSQELPVATVEQTVEEEPLAYEGESVEEEPYLQDYPYSFEFENNLLVPGEYHDGEVIWETNTREWVGLVREFDNTYSVRSLQPKMSRVYDPLLDEEGETTAIKVEAMSVGEVIFMLDHEDVNLGSVPAVEDIPTELYSGTSFEFALANKKYKLFAEGSASEENTKKWIDDDMTYTLSLKVEGQASIIELLILENLSEAMPSIEFIGDLNGDGVVDFLINTTNHYNMSRPTLYLSRAVNGVIQIRPVAALTSLGC